MTRKISLAQCSPYICRDISILASASDSPCMLTAYERLSTGHLNPLPTRLAQSAEARSGALLGSALLCEGSARGESCAPVSNAGVLLCGMVDHGVGARVVVLLVNRTSEPLTHGPHSDWPPVQPDQRILPRSLHPTNTVARKLTLAKFIAWSRGGRTCTSHVLRGAYLFTYHCAPRKYCKALESPVAS